MADLVWLIPAFPLAGFLTILLFGRRLGDPKAGYLATAAVFASFAVAAAIYFDLLSRPEEDRQTVVTLFSWVPVGTLQVDLAFLADPLSILMCLFITFIAGWIHMFAVGYMHGDAKFSKFFLYMNLFVFAMTILVLGENLLVTFLGWEGVGTCSYLLIAFWHTRESAATAGKKAFVTNRVGDWGVMLAMFLAFSAVGSLSYTVLNEGAETGDARRVDGIGDRDPAADRCRRQERAAAAVPLAARRDGGPDTRVGAHPRGDDGDRWRVPPHPHQPGDPGVVRLGADHDRLGRWPHRPVRGDDRTGTERHQEGAGLLDRVADRLHDARRRQRCVRGGHLPHGDARRLQGAAVPRRRVGDPRHARGAGHALHGRPAQVHADHRGDVHRRLAGDRRRAAVLGLLVEGRDPAVHARRQHSPVRRRDHHRGADGVLHDPPDHHGLLRRGPLDEPRQRRGGPRGRRGRAARRDAQRARRVQAARVAPDHVDPARRARGRRHARRHRQHAQAVRHPVGGAPTSSRSGCIR